MGSSAPLDSVGSWDLRLPSGLFWISPESMGNAQRAARFPYSEKVPLELECLASSWRFSVLASPLDVLAPVLYGMKDLSRSPLMGIGSLVTHRVGRVGHEASAPAFQLSHDPRTALYPLGTLGVLQCFLRCWRSGKSSLPLGPSAVFPELARDARPTAIRARLTQQRL